ncbi:TIGR01459 family HAD-type hydrolase [Phreatobacter cathodiphilus]|uniref:TIGR01459 family HAD-type hydrolase n=1 Tax=Phreatobacter cathodiphilus TaxID=1868589 RepID=A0A2S0N646_9HYPH|nr:TIGR01459 family HAD-type hydrolase [Phreatobacter cathodiphilus]AVO43622.1 TIGR01459 family HAD-type hydrolase [Phreatobacter cathodiphilus]
MTDTIAAPPLSTAAVIDGLSAIAGDYDLVFSDVWGVLHNGMKAHPAACEALVAIRRSGVPVILITNAPRQAPVVVGQLDRLGVPRAAYDAIVTSGDVSRDYMRTRPGAPVHHVGPQRDLVVFEGIDTRLVDIEEADYVVCTGLVDDRTETPDDYQERLERMKARDLFFLCGNPDKVVEVGHDLIFCAGAIGDRYQSMGGKVLYAGKPYEPAYEACWRYAERILGHRPPNNRVLAIGDAMRTDVAGAARMGFDCLFLAEGIHAEVLLDEAGVKAEGLAALIAETGHQPRHVMRKLVW